MLSVYYYYQNVNSAANRSSAARDIEIIQNTSILRFHSSNGIKVLYCYKMYGMNADDGIRETTRSSMRRVSSLNSAGPTTSGDSRDLFSSLQGAESDRPWETGCVSRRAVSGFCCCCDPNVKFCNRVSNPATVQPGIESLDFRDIVRLLFVE